MVKLFFASGLVVMAGIAIPCSGQTARRPAHGAQTFEAAMFRLEDPHATVDYHRPDASNQNRLKGLM
jgi:hypothetical protein